MKKFISFATMSLLPFVASAQNTGLSNLIDSFGAILKQLFPIAIAIAVLMFFYTIIMFIYEQSKGDAEKAKTYKDGIMYSLLALTIMFVFFGVIKLIANTFGVGNVVGQDINSSDIPRVNF